MNLLFQNVRMVDSRKDIPGALYVENGKIAKIIEAGDQRTLQEVLEGKPVVIDGGNLCLMPAFTDLHFHMRYPGQEEKETMETGEAAAVKGGYTALCAMGNTRPVCDSPDVFEMIRKRHEEVNLCDLFQISAVTKNLEGKEAVDFAAMRKLTHLFSDDGKTLWNPEIMRLALEKSKDLDFILMTHSEPEAETVERDLMMLGEIQGRLHVCHISEKETVELIRRGKKDFGAALTCEVTPHHLFAEGLDYRVNPPFGNADDRAALLNAVREGLIDAIGTDHAPHTQKDKLGGSPGISGVEVAFEIVHTVFKRENIGLGRLVEMMAENPADMLGLDKGRLEEGFDADLVLADLDAKKRIKADEFLSKGRNTPFDGWETEGEIVMTVRRGEIAYDNRPIA